MTAIHLNGASLHMCISKYIPWNSIEHFSIVNEQSVVGQRVLSGSKCDQSCERQVLVLAELITEECPYANTQAFTEL